MTMMMARLVQLVKRSGRAEQMGCAGTWLCTCMCVVVGWGGSPHARTHTYTSPNPPPPNISHAHTHAHPRCPPPPPPCRQADDPVLAKEWQEVKGLAKVKAAAMIERLCGEWVGAWPCGTGEEGGAVWAE